VSRQTLTGEPADGWFPDQRLTIEEAIEAYTRAPAWASFEEDRKGTLAPGMLADIAVFDTNLIEVGRPSRGGCSTRRSGTRSWAAGWCSNARTHDRLAALASVRTRPTDRTRSVPVY
jgi:hypothetical protein